MTPVSQTIMRETQGPSLEGNDKMGGGVSIALSAHYPALA